ncbi:MAG TPA: asparagine synthase-related protein [Verrucomicrobiales bacterium]|nr:asparagine synthase-related protein [Verrucomicrobiales bacterium]
MGGIAGIFHSDGRPVDPEVLDRMAGAMAPRGPDGRRTLIEGPLALLSLELRTSPEAHAEVQPLRDPAGRFLLVWDGRLDHREELRRALLQQGASLRNYTDAELVLQAWLAWGPGCPDRLRGDFAYALWDRDRQEFHCARDPAGLRPFYYHRGASLFVFATEPAAVLAVPGVSGKLNEGMLAEYLTDSLRSVEETLYSSVLRLPPGHWMRVPRDGPARVGAYYDLLRRPPAPPDAETGRVDQFAELFERAVQSRLRAEGRLAFDLSGGLDSSAIVAAAGSLMGGATPRIPKRPLETFSLVFPGESCDETPFIEAVEQAYACHGRHTIPEPLPLDFWREIGRKSRLPPPPPNSSLITRWTSWPRHEGWRVLITGVGGDECFLPWRPPVHAPAQKPLGGAAMVWMVLTGLWKRRSRPQILRAFLREGILPWVPTRCRSAIRTWRARRPGRWPWLDPAFVRRSGLADRLRATPPCGLDPWSVAALELEDFHRRWLHLELRSPFLDRDLKEFCLSLPPHCLETGTESKILLREALRKDAKFPPEIRARSDKAEFSLLFRRTWERHRAAGDYGKDWTAGGRLRPGVMAHWIDALSQKELSNFVKYLWTAWHGYAINLWIASDGGSDREISSRPRHLRSDESQKDLPET